MEGGFRDFHTHGTVRLLLGLAALADRAGGRCFAVRFLVLAILARAEAVARAHVVATVPDAWLWFDEPALSCGLPDSAVALALRFRLLAAALADLQRLECLAESCRIAGPTPGHALPRGPRRAAAGRAPAPADTS